MTPLARRRGGDHATFAFATRTTLILVAVLASMLLAAAFHPAAHLTLVVPAVGAAILGSAYLRRPAEALLSLALIIVFYDTLARYSVPAVKQLDEIGVGLIFLVALLRGASAARLWFWWPRELALGVVFATALASTAAAHVPLDVWFPELLLVGKPIAFFYAVMWTPIRREEIRAGMAFVLGLALVVVILGFIELAVPTWFLEVFRLPYFAPRGPLPVVKSVFIHPAIFGWFTAFVSLFLFAMFLATSAKRWLALAFIVSLGPILSARRKAILGMGVGLLAAVADGLRRRPRPLDLARSWLPIAAGLAVLVLLFTPVFAGLYTQTIDRYVPHGPAPSPSQIPSQAGEDIDPQARVALYLGAVRIAVDRAPLGVGLGRYASWMSRTHYSPAYEEYGISGVHGLGSKNPRYVTDTFWPQILGEFGIIGFLAYIAFLASLGWILWRSALTADTAWMRAFRLGAGMVFAQALVESAANAMFHSPPRAMLLFLVIGTVASNWWRERSALSRTQEPVPLS